MDKERLKSSFEKVNRKTRQAQARERREFAQRVAQNERIKKRMASFHEFTERNRKIIKRAKVIVEAGQSNPAEDEPKSTLVVLGIGEQETDISRRNIVARLTEVPAGHDQNPRESIHFNFFAVSDDDLEKIQSDPGGYKLNKKGWTDNADELGQESTYIVSVDSSSTGNVISEQNDRDELIRQGHLTHPARGFNPIGAVERAIDGKKISRKLDQLESTIDMVEEAALDPELNPALAQNLAETQQPAQATA